MGYYWAGCFLLLLPNISIGGVFFERVVEALEILIFVLSCEMKKSEASIWPPPAIDSLVIQLIGASFGHTCLAGDAALFVMQDTVLKASF